MDDEITSRSSAVRHTFDCSLHRKNNLSRGGRRRERKHDDRRGATERAVTKFGGGRGRRGSRSFCGFATQADRKIRNE